MCYQHRTLGWVILALLGAAAEPSMATWYAPVDISAVCNRRIQSNDQEGTWAAFPEGDFVLGGVPFHTTVGANNTWGHTLWTGFGRRDVIDIPVGQYGVSTAYTLFNTDWGQNRLGYLQVEFFGSGGAYAKKDLLGNDDIRDWNGWWTNQINGTTTTNVYYIQHGHDGDPDYLDMQRYALPPDFANQTLETIRLTDWCLEGVHSAKLHGVTVSDVLSPPQAYAGGPYILRGDTVTLRGAASFAFTNAAWDLDGDGAYDDAFGLTPALSYDYLTHGLGLDPDGYHEIRLRVDGEIDTAALIPEPVTSALVALGSLPVWYRRRR